MKTNILIFMKKNNEKPYEFFDVTADIGFVAFGNNLNNAFESAAIAMFDIISNTEYIEAITKLDIEICSEDKISLLYDFLEELLFLHEVKFLLFSKFSVNIQKINDEKYKLNATIYGEDIDWNKHVKGSEVKAVTFHMMDLVETEDSTKLRVILDL